MGDDIFSQLEREIAEDTDSSGVPSSAWYWDQILDQAVTLYTGGGAPLRSHLELRGEREPIPQGLGVQLGSDDSRFLLVDKTSPSPTALVGSHTGRDVSIFPVQMAAVVPGETHTIEAWTAVTRGGQRWARITCEGRDMLVDLDDPGELPWWAGVALGPVGYVSRTQQIHMGLSIPEPDITPAEFVSLSAVAGAAQRCQEAYPEPAGSQEESAVRTLQGRVIMRASVIDTLISCHEVLPDVLPVEALIRIHMNTVNFDPHEASTPGTVTRVLSPGAASTIRAAMDELEGATWDDMPVETMQATTGLPAEDVQWWGAKGAAYTAEALTGGLSGVWDSLTSPLAPFGAELLRDAGSLGVAVPGN